MSLLGPIEELEKKMDDYVHKLHERSKCIQAILESTDQNILIVDKGTTAKDIINQTQLLSKNSKYIDLSGKDDKDFKDLYKEICSDNYNVLILENIDRISDQALDTKALIRSVLADKHKSVLKDKRIICKCESIPGYIRTYLPDTCIIK